MGESATLSRALNEALAAAGENQVIAALAKLSADREEHFELTIIANSGIHTIPERFIHGEKYIASKGSLDLASREATETTYVRALRSLAAKLNEHPWKKVYLIPTGPATLAMQIKLLVYHVTRLATIDLFYADGDYFELDLHYRTYL
jgi:hypothetical protein